MNPPDIHRGPVWGEPERGDSPQLRTDMRVDACVVGAGIAGLSVAYHLAKAGKSVLVLDDGPSAGGQTGRTTAHLTAVLDDRFFTLENIRGVDAAQLAAQSHTTAIDCIEDTVREARIDCDFERLDGYLFNSPGSAPDILDKELRAARSAGMAVEPLLRAPIDAFDTGPCLRFPHQGQFHPLKYMAGLARAVKRGRGQIVTGMHVERIEGGHPAWVTIRNGPVVLADAVVVATNAPVNDLVAIHTKQAAYLTYVIATPVPVNAVTRALYWDTLDPYHFVRLQTPGQGPTTQEMLIIGGEDHRTGQADDGEQRYARLEAWARERFPMMGEVAHCWSGQVMETIDGLAFIGRNPMDSSNVFVATGDSGMGMTHGTIAGLLITDLILGKENPWTALYDPSRRPIRGLLRFAGETLNMASQYSDWVTGGDVASVEEIPWDSGAVIRRGLQKVAAYRDERGEVHEFSARCTHLGCIVHWNHAEKTWDCPCHGSRYASEGSVIQGPANVDLKPLHARQEVVH
jgi:glycine/D-amino acid oxidase-like deaminating enzyme/nitrite reductase/ring-hydroxylating ferredoxin subunit